MTPPSRPTSLADRMAFTLDGVCRAIAQHAARNRASAPLLLLVWGYLRRAMRRFERLVARGGAHRLRVAPEPRLRTSRPASLRPPRLPCGFGWLGRMVPEARVYGSQLQHLLNDPAMVSLLGASPQTGRILRPLCRMLGVALGTGGPPPSAGPSRPETPPQAAPPVGLADPPNPLSPWSPPSQSDRGARAPSHAHFVLYS